MAGADGPHLLLYDGVCGLCNGIVRFVLGVDRRGVFHFASLQSPAAATHLQRFALNPADLDTFVAIANYQTAAAAAFAKGSAAIFVAKKLGWPWKIAGLAEWLPLTALNAVYDFVARNRYLIAGKRDHCVLPTSETRTRFLDI